MKPGTRIRMTSKVPWPERVGLEGVIVDGAIFAGKYPYDKRAKDTAIVLLDNDPLTEKADDRRWTCVVELEDIEAVPTESDSQGEG